MVYMPEWMIYYTSQARGSAGWDECLDWFTAHYRGKIRSKDMRIVTPDGNQQGDVRVNYAGKWRLQLYVPNLKGIRADKESAQELAAQLGQDAEIVARFSAEERKLLRYGKSLVREP